MSGELKTVAYLVDCFVEPALEFADVQVPDAAIPLVRGDEAASAIQALIASLESSEAHRDTAVSMWADEHKTREASEARAKELEKALGGLLRGEYVDNDGKPYQSQFLADRIAEAETALRNVKETGNG